LRVFTYLQFGISGSQWDGWCVVKIFSPSTLCLHLRCYCWLVDCLVCCFADGPETVQCYKYGCVLELRSWYCRIGFI